MNKAAFLLILASVVCNNTINASQADRFAKAAKAGDQKTIIAMLNDGFDVDAPLNAKGQTALHIAAAERNLELVELLIMRSAAVNSRDNDENTPLLSALSIIGANKLVVTMLLNNKADVDAQNKRGTTALIHAAWEGDVDMVALLLERNATVNLMDKHKKTALDHSNRGKFPIHKKISELLRAAGGKSGIMKSRR